MKYESKQLVHIKAIHPEAHIAIVTQHTQDSYREEAMAHGAELFISKENVTQLKDTLNQLIQL